MRIGLQKFHAFLMKNVDFCSPFCICRRTQCPWDMIRKGWKKCNKLILEQWMFCWKCRNYANFFCKGILGTIICKSQSQGMRHNTANGIESVSFCMR